MTFQVIIDGVEYAPVGPDMSSETTFPELMRKTRKHFGWTIEEAARKIGVGTHAIGSWESGSKVPSLHMAYLISKAYDVTLAKLALAVIYSDGA